MISKPRFLRPLSRVRPPPLVVRNATVGLGPMAEEILFGLAEVLVEGRTSSDARAHHTWFGSVLISIDLAKHGRLIVGNAHATEAEYELLRAAVEGSVRFRLLCMRAALREARARAVGDFGKATTDTRVRLQGSTLLVDVEIEVPVGAQRSNTA